MAGWQAGLLMLVQTVLRCSWLAALFQLINQSCVIDVSFLLFVQFVLDFG